MPTRLFSIFGRTGFTARSHKLECHWAAPKRATTIVSSLSSSPEKYGRACKPILMTLLLAGCQRPDDIVRYTVARPRPIQTAASAAANDDSVWVPGQLLGAIVPQGQQTWFFKLTGRLELVKPQLEPFLAFTKSVRLTDKGPEWTLPEGWEQRPGDDNRFATLKIPTEKKPL